jgi:hypothetical protein
MRTVIKLAYKCRWCREMFYSSTEFLDNFKMNDRLHQMHYCNEKEYNTYPDVIELCSGVGDLVGYKVQVRK